MSRAVLTTFGWLVASFVRKPPMGPPSWSRTLPPWIAPLPMSSSGIAAHLTGQEVRFLRGLVDLTQDELGKLLGKDAQSIARWERSKTRIPPTEDRALRQIFLEYLGIQQRFTDTIRQVAAIDKERGYVDRQGERGTVPGLSPCRNVFGLGAIVFRHQSRPKVLIGPPPRVVRHPGAPQRVRLEKSCGGRPSPLEAERRHHVPCQHRLPLRRRPALTPAFAPRGQDRPTM